jgi:transposase
VACIDLCSIYASAVRRMLPHATLTVDLFHVVQLAVKAADDVRRRVVRAWYGRRGRSGDPEYGVKGLLVRNLEHLSPDQFAKITAPWTATGTGRKSPAPGSRRKAARRLEPAGTGDRLHPVPARRAGPPVLLL